MKLPWSLKLGCIALVHLLGAWLMVQAFREGGTWAQLILGSVLGHLSLDAITLLVHWTLDNYFSERTPVIGDIVFYFREHHDLPMAMFQRGYVENNFENALIGLGFEVLGLGIHPGPVGSMLLGFGSIGSAYITLIHKWAHLESPGPLARLLQRALVIVSTEHHAVHHRGAGRHYGLAAGWVDGLFDRFKVLELLELAVLKATGVRPVHSRLSPGAAELRGDAR